ncbi:hypothetical protein DFH06DRAFT_1082678 [Mycena polygramma]|nr:hypothetical protein DFH06DRAFT_1082678 [Mycena polygramma]
MDVDNTPVRVEELWFSDGSLVIQAQTSLFRVSGAVLAARSDVFKDMLSLPQPATGSADVEEKIEGCPVVRLPDAAVDVKRFLKAIFDSSFFETYPTKTDFSTVLSVLRLGNKYGVGYLRRRALVHLSSGAPTSLSQFDDDEGSSMSDIGSFYSWRYRPAIRAIEVAREIGALWIIPWMFYAIAATDNETILKILGTNRRSVELSPSDRTLFLKSSIQISLATNDILWFLHSPYSIPGCKGKCAIQKARVAASATIQEHLRTDEGWVDPLDLCDDAGIWKPLKDSCCRVCYEFCSEANEDARQAFWDRLPEICDLPPWEELEKMKEQALEA